MESKVRGKAAASEETTRRAFFEQSGVLLGGLVGTANEASGGADWSIRVVDLCDLPPEAVARLSPNATQLTLADMQAMAQGGFSPLGLSREITVRDVKTLSDAVLKDRRLQTGSGELLGAACCCCCCCKGCNGSVEVQAQA